MKMLASSPCVTEILTTAGPAAAAALTIVFRPKQARQHLESSFSPEFSVAGFVAGIELAECGKEDPTYMYKRKWIQQTIS